LKRKFKYFLCYITATLVLYSCTEKIKIDYLITNINVIDVFNGKILEARNIGVTDERIVFVSKDPVASYEAVRLIDGKGKFIIPGYWDMHVHYWWNYASTTPLLLSNGIVGVREMFGNMNTVHLMRDLCKEGSVALPEIVSAGRIIDGIPASWQGSDTIVNGNGAKEIIDLQVQEGVDFLKVYSNLDSASYWAIAREANNRNTPFAGHLPDKVSIWDGIKLKQKSFEHLYGLVEGCSMHQDTLRVLKSKGQWISKEIVSFLYRSFNKRIFDSLSIVLAKSESWICPTLIALTGYFEPIDFRNPRLKYLPKDFVDLWRQNKAYDSLTRKRIKDFYLFNESLIGPMQKAGVKFLVGSDFPNPNCYPGFSFHEELQLLVKGGMTPKEALVAATYNPAVYLRRLKDYGTIEPGKIASMVLLDKNPLEDIRNSNEIYAVFFKGNFFSKDSLEDMKRNVIN
jgi:imidazolonepropionase-like amidohydrolase